MIRSALLQRLTPCILTCTRGPCLPRDRTPSGVHPHSASQTPIQQSLDEPLIPKCSAVVRYSDLAKEKFTMIYTFPHINLLRVVSRLKMLQTGITVVMLPPMFIFYQQGDLPFSHVTYSTGIALFAGVMLYTASHFFRRVVGRLYLDQSQTTLKVSHLTFWGRRHNIYLPVSDVMTIGDTGDTENETILKLKRYSSPETFYFSTHFGRVLDKQGFQRVFGTLK